MIYTTLFLIDFYWKNLEKIEKIPPKMVFFKTLAETKFFRFPRGSRKLGPKWVFGPPSGRAHCHFLTIFPTFPPKIGPNCLLKGIVPKKSKITKNSKNRRFSRNFHDFLVKNLIPSMGHIFWIYTSFLIPRIDDFLRGRYYRLFR